MSVLDIPGGDDCVFADAWVWIIYIRQYSANVLHSGHIRLAERFVDPALSFAMGYNYLYNWLIVLWVNLSYLSVHVDLLAARIF